MLTLEALRSYGADVEEGLHRCMNMEAFYLKLFDSLKGDTRVEELKARHCRKGSGPGLRNRPRPEGDLRQPVPDAAFPADSGADGAAPCPEGYGLFRPPGGDYRPEGEAGRPPVMSSAEFRCVKTAARPGGRFAVCLFNPGPESASGIPLYGCPPGSPAPGKAAPPRQ